MSLVCSILIKLNVVFMVSKQASMAAVEQAAAVTDQRVLRGEFLWTVNSFSQLDAEVGKLTTSPQFTLLGTQWSMRLYPGGEKEASKNHLSLFLKNESKEAVPITYKFEIVDSEGEQLKAKKQRARNMAAGSSWGLAKLIDRDEVLDKDDEYLDENDTLRIKLTLQKRDGTEHRTSNGTSNACFCVNNLSKTHARLLESGKNRSATCLTHLLRVVCTAT